jgi:hypothetical protein
MTRRSRKVRHIGDISTHRELTEMRERLTAKIRTAERRLAYDIEDTFSVDNLLELVAPPGSFVWRIVDGIRMGLATVRGVVNAIDYFRENRSRRY